MQHDRSRKELITTPVDRFIRADMRQKPVTAAKFGHSRNGVVRLWNLLGLCGRTEWEAGPRQEYECCSQRAESDVLHRRILAQKRSLV